MVKNVYKYLTKHRELTKDYFFYTISIAVSLFEKEYDKAFAWSDSALAKFPNDKLTFYDKAKIYGVLAYYTKTDSATTNKNKRLYLENLRKAIEPGRTAETENNIDNIVNISLGFFYYTEKDYKSFIDIVETTNIRYSLDASQNNVLAYAYIYRKDYKKAEASIRKALFLDDSVGDYWDSLAELYSLQKKDSLAVVNLAIALKCPRKSPAVSVEAYQKDARWQRLRSREDFKKLMKRI